MRKQYSISNSPLYMLYSRKRLGQVLGFSPSDLMIAAQNPNYRCFKNENGRLCEQPVGLSGKIHTRIANLLKRIELPTYVKSKRGLSYVDNAKCHLGDVPSVRMDIAKFYPSTTFQSIREFFRFQARCSALVANELALICTVEGHLPTGSPISSYLSYFANMQMFEDLQALADSSGCVMTCYVDDIMFTGTSANADLLAKAVRVVRRANLRHNRKKSCVLPKGKPKRITGVIVTPTKISVPNKRQKSIGQLFDSVQSGDQTSKASLIGRLWEAAQIDERFKKKIPTVKR